VLGVRCSVLAGGKRCERGRARGGGAGQPAPMIGFIKGALPRLIPDSLLCKRPCLPYSPPSFFSPVVRPQAHILLCCLNEIFIISSSAISPMSNSPLSVPSYGCPISVCAQSYARNARYLATHYNDQFLRFLDHMTIRRSDSPA
jgi:hypothetical protein